MLRLALAGIVSILASPIAHADPGPDIEVEGAAADATLAFPCGELRCRGSLFLPPAASEPPPVVVMAHGLTLTREYLARRAARFAQAGIAVFTFDYRNFGGSEGEPRYDVSAPRQLEDWRAAIRFARSLREVDGERMALFGTSYSGGHVLALASRDDALRAVVAQVPYVGAAVEDERGFFFLPRVLLALALDGVLRPFGSAFYVDVAGPPGALAGITIAEDQAELARLIASVEPSNWRNRMPARVLYRVATYVPDLEPEKIGCPVLFYATDADRITPAAAVRALAARVPDASFTLLEGGHFGVYLGASFERTVTEQIAFLGAHLARAPR